MRVVLKPLAALGILVFAQYSFAAPIMCDAATAAAVVGNIGCVIVPGDGPGGGNDNDSVTSVNTNMLFGNADWFDAGKVDFPDAGSVDGADGMLTVEGDVQSGDWSISGLIGNAILVLKDGNANIPLVLNGGYIAYLVNTSSGTYSTPFINMSGGGPDGPKMNPKNISHISLYKREGTQVPEPASLGLLGLGLLGLGLIRRRRA